VLQILRGKVIPNQIEIRKLPSYGRGALIFLKAVFEKTTACFSELGEIGKRMEEVSE
jgi:RNA 3'-terminal phosphate cyclase